MEYSEQRPVTACLIVIGNEILSGRTQEANLQQLATWLEGKGIQLKEAHVIPDEPDIIIEVVNSSRAKHDHVFTSGGIGPTHDDVTAATIARAFGVPLVLDSRAVASLKAYYGAEEVNDARLKMARVPKGGRLIENPVTGAPGFRLENVYVLPGIPRIFQAMLVNLAPRLRGGPHLQSVTLRVLARESDLATPLAEAQRQHPTVQIGSYPFMQDDQPGVALVLRGSDQESIARAQKSVEGLLETAGVSAA